MQAPPKWLLVTALLVAAVMALGQGQFSGPSVPANLPQTNQPQNWTADQTFRALLAVADSGVFVSSQKWSASACETSFGITTLSTGAATTNTGLSCLPANAVIDAVVYRITTTITTAASFTVGDATVAARFCGTQSTLTAGTTGICFAQADQTGTSGPRQVSATTARVTCNVTPGAGAMRLIVYYHTWVAPTS